METLHPPNIKIELAQFWTWMGDDGICRTKAKPRAEIILKDAMENSLAVNSFYTNKKYPLLVDARDVRSMQKEARSFFSTNGRETKINSMAIMVRSPLSRIIGNFFMGLNKPDIPARLFDEEPAAIEWLKKYVL